MEYYIPNIKCTVLVTESQCVFCEAGIKFEVIEMSSLLHRNRRTYCWPAILFTRLKRVQYYFIPSLQTKMLSSQSSLSLMRFTQPLSHLLWLPQSYFTVWLISCLLKCACHVLRKYRVKHSRGSFGRTLGRRGYGLVQRCIPVVTEKCPEKTTDNPVYIFILKLMGCNSF